MRFYIHLLLAVAFVLETPQPLYAHFPDDQADKQRRSQELPEELKRILVASRKQSGDDVASIEDELTEEHAERLRDLEQDFFETAADPETVDSSEITPRQEINEMPVETFINSDPKYLAGLFSRLMIFGRGKKLKEFFNRTMRNLSLPQDSQEYTVRISGSVMPNAAIIPKSAVMFVNIGLFSHTKNEDEMAYVIAHEMTHQNPNVLTAGTDSDAINSMLNDISGYSDLDPKQREELRADLGAVDRMIKGHYNPWAGYDFTKRMSAVMDTSWDLYLMKRIQRLIFRRDFNFMEAHPADEIRAAAIKAYILKRSREIDLSDLTKSYRKWETALNTLRIQLSFIAKPIYSRWGMRAQEGFLLYPLLHLFMAESAASHYLGAAVNTGLFPLTWTFGKMGEVFALAWQLMPSMPPSLIENLPSSSQLVGTLFFGAMASAILACSTLIVMASHQLFKSHPKYPDYRKVIDEFKKYRELIEQGGPKVQMFLQQMRLLNEAAKPLESIYDSSGIIRSTRIFNGMSYAMMMSLTLYRTVLDDAIEYANTLSSADRDGFVEQVLRELDKMPPFTFDSARIRDRYLKLATLSTRVQVQALKTADEVRALMSTEDEGAKRLSLLATLASFDRNSEPTLIVSIAYALWEMGASDAAFELIGSFSSRLIDGVLTPENSDPKATKELARLLALSREGGTLRRNGYFARILNDLYLTAEKVRARFTGRREALLSLSKQIPSEPLFDPYWNWRSRYERADVLSLQDALVRNSSSLEDALKYLDEEVKQKGGIIHNLAPAFVNALAQRPDWIRSKADIDTLISRFELWPQFNGVISESSPLESAFIVGVRKLRDRFPAVWAFEPAFAEKVHAAILSRMKELGIYPQDIKGKIELWKTLTSRGVTTGTDNLFYEIYRQATGPEKMQLEAFALDEGRIWESEIKAEIANERVFKSAEFNDLITSASPEKRMQLVKDLVERIQKMLPEGGRVYWDLLENLSVRITSSEAESKYIADAKKLTEGGARQEDFGLRVLSQLTDEALGWRRRDQWALIQFLRRCGPVTPKIQNAFNIVGPERVQRMFDLLPLLARTELLDAFLDANRGLLGKFKADTGWGKTILDEIFADKDENETAIAKEILESFLTALKTSGNGALRSYVMAYLLAQPPGQSDTSLILKNVLEIFGATGVKIGQFLAASGLLPEKETAVLRGLQERAKIPAREEIYADIRDAIGKESLPFRIGDLKGAASIKYAVEVFDPVTQEKAILKMFRLESIAHTRLEFNLLEQMADFLVARHGAKYGIFRSIVRASRAAVERELVVSDEVKKSLAAQRYIYVNLDEEKITVKAPVEALMANRAILSEYADGGSFFNLRDDLKAVVASKILRMERDNLFSDNPVVLFDPDRHAGNYRISIQEYSGTNYLVVDSIGLNAIDMGQLLKVKPAERERIIELFAISQILREVGPNAQLAHRLGEMFSFSQKQVAKLKGALSGYFPEKNGQEITAYFALLSSLESVGTPIDIVHFDFVRAIIQLKQYEPYLAGKREWQTPSETFAAQVKLKANDLVAKLEMSTPEKLKFAWNNLDGAFWTRAVSMAKLIFSAAERKEFSTASCESRLLGKRSVAH